MSPFIVLCLDSSSFDQLSTYPHIPFFEHNPPYPMQRSTKNRHIAFEASLKLPFVALRPGTSTIRLHPPPFQSARPNAPPCQLYFPLCRARDQRQGFCPHGNAPKPHLIKSLSSHIAATVNKACCTRHAAQTDPQAQPSWSFAQTSAKFKCVLSEMRVASLIKKRERLRWRARRGATTPAKSECERTGNAKSRERAKEIGRCDLPS